MADTGELEGGTGHVSAVGRRSSHIWRWSSSAQVVSGDGGAGSAGSHPPGSSRGELLLGVPGTDDAMAMWMLLTRSGFDSISPSSYRQLCRRTADTSLVARDGNRVVGLITAYRRPTRPDTLLVRQIAVSPSYRRCGVGRAMLVCVKNRDAGSGVGWLEAKIRASSHASRRLFQSFAIAAELRYAELELTPDNCFPPPHEPEILVRMGDNLIPTRDDGTGEPATATRRSVLSNISALSVM